MRGDQCEMELLFMELEKMNAALKDTDLAAADITIGDLVRLVSGR